MYGVSPAYFISRFTDRFSFEEIARSLPDLRQAGFDAFQPEVFHTGTLEEWRRKGAERIRRAAADCGLAASQFVGHFLLHAFESAEAIVSDFGLVETEKALEGMARLPGCAILTVPIPPLALQDPRHLTPNGYAALRGRLVAKLGRMLEITERGGCRMSLEILPGSPCAGIHGFLRLCAELGSGTLGYNFDTGHAWSSKEWVPLIPAAAGPRLLGTHLKDNFQNENVPLAPGAGSIPWPATVSALSAAGYRGSWDIEFLSPAESATRDYAQALRFLRPLIEACAADGIAAVRAPSAAP